MHRLQITISFATLTVAIAGPVFAFDGWHLEHATTIEGKGSGYDYVSVDSGTHTNLCPIRLVGCGRSRSLTR